ncbi:cation/H(+) antiporter 24 isoform X2 [Salvia miltiorrhiza]|uniref:cation/H(+) antiporter 24 isoform X2 n=1 Tax=Salvia miltiorrhiza TaxID=226208 RepID=UPI0025AC5D05|nr:cation/H(+) antiporter 24 isoform X2 [Salvia miltiorrhiza]
MHDPPQSSLCSKRNSFTVNLWKNCKRQETFKMSMENGLFICRKKFNDNLFGVFFGQNPLKSSFPLVLLELTFLICVSRVVRLLLKPFGQPKVISEIIGGIILGPSVLCRSEKFRMYMFPDNAFYVIQNMGLIGFMYFLFISGVKMDIFAVRKADKKHWYIALVGVMGPLCCSIAVAFSWRKSMDTKMVKASSIWGITSSLAMTAFPVLYPIMKELNLLSSEIGRVALSIAVIGDVIGMNGVVIFEASKQGEGKPIAALWYIVSLTVVLASIFGGVRQFMIWIIRTTPVGKPVDQVYVIALLLGVFVVAFVADMLGLAVANGPLWLGLAVPDGPPLGAILVEKSETIITNIFMPFSYMYVGMITDLSSMSGHWYHLQPLLYVVLTGYIMKMVFTLIAARFLDMTIRDSLTLSLIMSLRGEIEFLLFIHWVDFKMVGVPEFTLLVLLTVSVTAVAAPLISILHDPTRPYMLNTRRTIQHTAPNNELHIVACIDEEENLYGLMKLLELFNPTASTPISVHALRLIELVGRANPVFIDHETEEDKGAEGCRFSSLHNALKIFAEARGDYVRILSYTAITPKRSMHQDIWTPARKSASQSLSSNVLKHAPCSVGVLVSKKEYPNLVSGLRSSMHHFILLFLGGADSREALSYADRAAGCPDTSLTVVRFLSHENEGDIEMEKKLDDQLVTSFWVKNEANERVVYREAVVKNGEETMAVIHAMNDECYDLWIVGRNHVNPVLLQGLSNWTEISELGVVGEYIASADFSSSASVLVVQQQILRGQKRNSGSLVGRFLLNEYWNKVMHI